jgi:hypothetical protein
MGQHFASKKVDQRTKLHRQTCTTTPHTGTRNKESSNYGGMCEPCIYVFYPAQRSSAVTL